MSSKKNNLEQKTFRELMEESESTTAQFDAIELDIEQALELHKRASELLDELERRLKSAESSVKKSGK